MKIAYVLSGVWALVLCLHGAVAAGVGISLRRVLHGSQQDDAQQAVLLIVCWFAANAIVPAVGEGLLSMRRHVDALMDWLVDYCDLTR